MEINWNLEKQGDVEEIVARLRKSEKEVEKEIDEDNMLESKMAQDCHFFLQPIKRLESYIYCLEKNPRNRIKELGSSSQVIRRDIGSSFYPYYFWEFWKFSLSLFLLLYFGFVILIKYSREQKGNQELNPYYPSLLL